MYCHDRPHDASTRILTCKRIPIPVKIALEGGNTCDTCQRVDRAAWNREITSPAASPIIAENVYKTLTVGSSHLVNLSSAPCDLSDSWTWARRIARIALGESQDLSWAARGWEAMSFFVFFSYSSRAALKIVSKLGEEVVVDGIWDILLAEGDRLYA